MIDQLRLLSLISPYLQQAVQPRSVAEQIQTQPPQADAEMQLRAMLGQMPQRQQPDIGRRILAGMVGLSGDMKAAESVNYGPYYREMEDWNAKFEPMAKLANIEGSRRTNQRLIDSSERTARTAADRLALAERTALGKQEIADKKLELERRRVRVLEYAQEHPELKKVVDKTGMLQLVNFRTGEKLDTGIDTTELDPSQMLSLKIEGQKDVARTTAAETRTTQAARYGLMEKLQEMRQKGAIELRQTPTGNFIAGASKGLQPSQQRIDRLNKAIRIVSQFPELDEYYEMDDDGNVKVIAGDDPDLQQMALTKLQAVEATGDVSISNPKTGSVTKPTVRSDGKTHVRRNGIDGWVTKPLPTDELIP